MSVTPMERRFQSGSARALKKGSRVSAQRAARSARDGDCSRRAALCAIKNGYTLMELMIVMAIIALLVAVAVPQYQKSLQRTKETLLKQNLFTLRTVIDEYTFDKKKAPQDLQDLVSEGYLRAVPIDPITRSDQTWRKIMEDALSMVDQTQPGIFDVRSGSDQKSLEGTLYSDW